MKPPESELLLLGGLLDAEDAAPLLDVCGWSSQQLYDPRVRLAWDFVRSFAQRRKKADATSVWSAGKSSNKFKDEDHAWLLSLQSANTLTRDSFLALADDMRRQLSARSVIEQMRRVAEHINKHGLNPSFVTGALETIAHELARDHVADQTAAAEMLEIIAEPEQREKAGGQLIIPTGLRVLDERISGFVPNLNMILSDPAVGKNTVISSMITTQARAGLKVGVFGLEEGSRFLSKRNLAHQLGIPVRNVGAAKWTPEQQELLASPAMAELHAALDRVQVYNWDGISADELVRRATGWVLKYGVQCIYIDHIGEIRHRVREGESYNWAVAESYRKIRDFAKRYCVPVVMLAHRKPEAVGRPGAPRPDDVGLTGEAHKMVRLMLGLWKKKQSLRCTVIKMNEGGDDAPTFELERIFEAALVDPAKGHIVSLEKEAREDRENKRQQGWEDRKAAIIEREKWNAMRKAEKKASEPVKVEEKKPEAQGTLLEVPAAAKPEVKT